MLTAPQVVAYDSEGGIAKSALQAIAIHRRGLHKGQKKYTKTTSAEEVVTSWDGAGKIAIITGCNSGLGMEAARVLAAKGTEVIMAVRDTARGEQAAAAIRSQHPSAKLTVMACDLSSLASVRSFCEAFLKLDKPCHILMANAGIMACPFSRTADGHEMQFGTNHLGHFALVQQLLPVLKTTGQQAGQPSRVVILSSGAHFGTYPDKIGGPMLLGSFNSEHCYHPYRAYAQSKLCNLLFMRELNKRLKAEGAAVLVAACHPGIILTGLDRHLNKSLSPVLTAVARVTMGWACKSVAQGAATQVFLATSHDIKGGQYYADCVPAPSSAAAHGADLGAKLWSLSEELVAEAVPAVQL